jgi:16S rRNA (guanine(527)-N(7))-methyltransferase RsmG
VVAENARTSSGARASIEQVLGRQPWETLRPALLGTGVDVERALGQLRQYAQLLLEWNRNVSNIMSKNDEQRIIERHLLESVAPARRLVESGAQRWIDFGSGAGFPAIPLAIAGVGGNWTLVESRRTKTLFVRKAIQDIVLHGFTVVNDRLENVALDSGYAGMFDGFISRATMRLGPTLALASPLVRAGGSAFLWKGSGREQEMEHDASWRNDWDTTDTVRVGTGPNVVAIFSRKHYN